MEDYNARVKHKKDEMVLGRFQRQYTAKGLYMVRLYATYKKIPTPKDNMAICSR